jgi:sulfoxide reductase catalytic subunit YedY
VHVLRRPGWSIPESLLAPESAWLDRRALIRGLGFAGLGALLPSVADARPAKKPTGPAPARHPVPEAFEWTLPPATKNEKYPLDRKLTDETVAASYNNFYELTTDKSEVWRLAHTLDVKPWQVRVSGLVEKELVLDLDDILKLGVEERTYRFRCVEAWSMAVPWLGVPMRALMERIKPLSSAKYVRLVTRDAPEMFPGVTAQHWFPWPYHEGLDIEEATNELTLLAVGIYGHALPNQHGAPIRLITPWKYGYKSIKSLAAIELVDAPPPTFWSTIAPGEYDFWGNVRPDIDHPRWSQATERVIPTGERVETLMYNGYGSYVAHLYPFYGD